MKLIKHHITPKHLLKHKPKEFVDREDNIVYLTLEQHIKAHRWLLMLVGSRGCAMCYHAMTTGKFGASGADHPLYGVPNPMRGKKHPPEVGAKISAKFQGTGNPFFGKKHSKKTKHRLSALRKGKLNPMYGVSRYGEENPMYGIHRYGEDNPMYGTNRCGSINPMYGKTHSQETKDIISKANKGRLAGPNNPMYGNTHTEEAKAKIKASAEGRVWISNTRVKLIKRIKIELLPYYIGRGWCRGRKSFA